MERNSQRTGWAYSRRSLVATVGLALLVGGGAAVKSSPLQTQDNTTGPAKPSAAVPQTPAGATKVPAAGSPQLPSPGTVQAPPAGTTQAPGGDPTQRGRRGNRNGGRAADQTPGGFGTTPTTGFKSSGTRSGTMISMDFHGTDITNVLKVFANATQLPIVADPGVTGPVTIISPKQVTLDEGFRILQSVLAVRGFTIQQQDNLLQVVPFDVGIKSGGSKVLQGTDSANLDTRNQIITQVIPLENVDADAIAKELTPLINKGASLVGAAGSNALVITDSASNVKRILELVAALDKTNTRSEMAVYQLHHAEATGIADLINNIYGKITTRGKSGPAPGPGQPGFNPAQGQLAASGGTPSVVAIAEPGTNSLIVVASRDNQEQITQTIINRLDDDDANTLTTKLRKIKYADATTIASTVNQALSDAHGALTSGSTGGGFGGRAFGGFGALFGGGSGTNGVTQSTDPFAKVAAEARTNSILITATPEKMVKIEDLIDQMDVNIAVQSTTFVIPLNNAQASDVATALTAAFSSNGSNSQYNPQLTGSIGGSGSKSGAGVPTHNPIQRRPTTTNTGGRAAVRIGSGTTNGAITPPGPPNAPDGGTQGDVYTLDNGGSAEPTGVPGIMTSNGFVPTSAGNAATDALTRQFGGFGGGGFGGNRGGGGGFGQGGGNRGNTVGQPVGGPGQNGAFTGLLQLQGNVVVVPSPNGDSIIVTTTPNNYEAIKGIVDALDTIPRQVMIEVIVAEVSLNTDSKLGFNMNNVLKGLGGSTTGSILTNLPATGFGTATTVDSTQSGLQAVISSANHQGLLQALGTDTKVRVVATPRVFTANNQPALVDIATQVPYITGQSVSAVSTSTVLTNTVDYASIGFTLYVTPRITRDGLVTVDCVEDASDLVTNLTLGSGANAVTAPEFDDRYTDTTVTVKDGDTAVIGGLIQDRSTLTINKVPVLSDIPILGQFFRSREKQKQRVELMIFLTPHVVSTSEEIKALANKAGAPVISQIEELSQDQPNLKKPPVTKKGTTRTPATTDSNTTPTKSVAPPTNPSSGLDPSGKPILIPNSGKPAQGTPTTPPPTTIPPPAP